MRRLFESVQHDDLAVSVSGLAVLVVEQSKSQVLGDRVTIPRPNDDDKATFTKALVKLRISMNPQSHPVAQKTGDNGEITPSNSLQSNTPKWQRPHMRASFGPASRYTQLP